MSLTSRRSQPPLALSVPLSRFTPRVGGGSAFFVRRHSHHAMQTTFQQLPQWAQLVLSVIPAVSATFAALALLLNFYQSRRTNAQARAALVAGCLKGFTDDDDIQKAFYAIEYGTFTYGPSFHKSPQEREIDKLLRHFANLALSWKSGLLSTEDVRWSKTAGLGQHPYSVLVQLSDELSNLSP